MLQKSYEKEKSIFYIVPTPIGNLKDITYRAVEILQNVDVIFAEDTRVTLQLLKLLNINNKVIACHKFNEKQMVPVALRYLEDDKNIAMVTDRGTPLISDPGSVVVKEIINHNFTVVALPGACAFIPALNMSNISADKFLFYGFLNAKDSQALKELEMLKSINFTIVLYEAPHRVYKTLQNILKILGNKNISISREITKLHEEVFRGTVSEAIEIYKEPKGEFVIVIDNEENEYNINYECLLSEVDRYVKLGLKSNDAIKEVANKFNFSRNELYNLFQGRKK